MKRKNSKFSYLLLIVIICYSLTPLFAGSNNMKVNYQGYLKLSGNPVNGVKGFVFRIRDGAAGAIQWQSTCTNITVSSGIFRTVLGDADEAGYNWGAVNWGGIEAHLEILIGDADTCGSQITMTPPERFMSTPYSLLVSSAAEAVNGVPRQAVGFFNLPSCPSGWTEYTVARGRYLVGLNSGGLLGGTTGVALTNQENRAVGQHNHSVTDAGHTHGIHVLTTGVLQGGSEVQRIQSGATSGT